MIRANNPRGLAAWSAFTRNAIAVFAALTIVTTTRAAQPDAQEVWTSFNSNDYTQPTLDDKTLVKQWRATEVSGVPAGRITTATPAIRKKYELTGKTKPPVEVVRMSAGLPELKLSLGNLAISAYAVRFIGMVNTEDIERIRKPVYIELIVTPGNGGKPQRYRHRIPYWDDFYSVTELYFMVDIPGNFDATIRLGKGSLVDFQLNRVELHDVLAPLAKRASKESPTTFSLRDREILRANADPQQVLKEVERWTKRLDPYLRDPNTPELTPQQRTERDTAIWNALPPLNSMITGYYPLGYNDKPVLSPPSHDMKAIQEKFGVWRWENGRYPWLQPLTLYNDKLGLRYTRKDFENYMPLPKPYPLQDDGSGYYIAKTGDMAKAENYAWLAWLMSLRERYTLSLIAPTDGTDLWHHLPYLYHANGNKRAAREAAFLLAAYAYRYPAMTQSRDVYETLESPTGLYNRDLRLDRRYLATITHAQQGMAQSYDLLFDYIKGNDELAKAVGRFIPWIKTEEDLRRMIETRVLQLGARQSMHFNIYNDKESPIFLFRTALIQQYPEITEPWMKFLWEKTWIYPHHAAGLPDYISSTMQRDGSTDIGSIFYTGQGSPMGQLALWSKAYVKGGGNPRFDLTDPKRYGKMQAAGAFILDQTVTGGFPMAIGDVGDPYKPRMMNVNFNSQGQLFRDGYQLGGDPRMAWMIKHYFGRGAEDDETWQQIEEKAKTVGGNPLLMPNPRVMANWAGILEHGTGAQDFRFLTSVQMRIGTGYGHAHDDTLDLLLNAHGVRMLNDLCWRGSYSSPKPNRTQMHNVVEVDEINWQGHAWVDAFAPSSDVSFMRSQTTPPAAAPHVNKRNRSVALVAVDDGQPGSQPPAPLPYTNNTRFDPSAVTPNSYVFDVQRVSGGKLHTWCFHGTISDDFQVNMINPSESLPSEDATYLRRFLNGNGLKYSGDAPETAIATWRLRRDTNTLQGVTRNGDTIAMKQVNAEQRMLNATYDESAPRKYTRVHLAEHETSRLLVGHFEPNVPTRSDTWPFLYAQRRSAEPMDSVFAGIIEPYAGKPFIEEVKSLPISHNEKDADRAVAVQVLLKDGREDLCFSDDHIKRRRFGAWQIEGGFAFARVDDKGLVRAKLVEGTRLYTRWGALNVTRSAYAAKITKVDYGARRVWLSTSWSDAKCIGEQIEFGNDKHRTSYTVTDATRENGKLILTLDKAIDLSYAHITGVDVEKQLVYVNIKPMAVNHNGKNAGLTCTVNDDDKRSWQCKSAPDRSYRINQPFTKKDFPVGGTFRLWEFGVGDEARMTTHADVARQADGSYAVTSNGNATWRGN